MERAEITGPEAPLAIKKYPIPEAPAKGLLLKTDYSGICHTDLHLIKDEVSLGDGKFWRHRDVLGDKFIGVVPGHEIMGTILALGKDVPADSGLSVGDKVIIFPWRGCRECAVCQGEYNNMCANNQATTTDIGKGLNQGGYSSHNPIPEWQLAVKCPSNIPPEVSCNLPCSALTTYSAAERIRASVERAKEINGQARVMIVGAGGLGVWCTLIVKAMYKEFNVHVTTVDIAEDRLEACRAVGADAGLVWPIDASELQLIDITAAAGKMDAVFDIVGTPKTFRASFYSLNNGGTLVPLGLSGGQCVVPLPHVVGRSITIAGNRVGNPKQLRALVAMVEKEGIPKLPPTEIYELSQVNEVLDKMRARKIKGRAVLKF